MSLKLLQKKQSAEATDDLIGNKVDNKIAKFQKIHTKINQRSLQINIIKEYLKKDMYLQKKDKKVLMNWNWSSIIMEYKKITRK